VDDKGTHGHTGKIGVFGAAHEFTVEKAAVNGNRESVWLFFWKRKPAVTVHLG
jgi:hypothetical protein